MKIDGQRLWRQLDELAALTEPDRPWTRRSFTPRFLEGRAWLKAQFEAAGLQVRMDAGGNLFGRLPGRNRALPPLLTGSHSDSVPSGGRYDGMLGVLASLEVARSLQARGETLAHDLDVVDFLAEEPSEFGLSCIGSRAFVGHLDEAMLALQRPDGMTLADGLRYVGGDPDRLHEARQQPGSVAAYIELHIEQGKILERGRLDVGVVTGLASIRRYRVRVTGRTDHAGQTPMDDRADALLGAARLIDGVYRCALARSTSEAPFVATVGRIEQVRPNAANAVAGSADLVLECRCPDERSVETFLDDVLAPLLADLNRMGIQVAHELLSHVPPSPCAPLVQSAITQAAQAAGYGHTRLSSGAGHDGMFVRHVAPFGMIFVPCLDGRSHTPEEWLSPEQAAVGADALYGAILHLDAALSTAGH